MSLVIPSDLFFFSSRRRHTRCYRDWSSDVCSSDLIEQFAGHVTLQALLFPAQANVQSGVLAHGPGVVYVSRMVLSCAPCHTAIKTRSEERRVGKETIKRMYAGS